MDDARYMLRALELARKGWPQVAPNPMVGCVIVANQTIVAEGYHQHYGDAHAEVNAVNALPADIDKSKCTMYVSLEPCSHFGKTPPCADLLVKNGFKKVVICNTDPNPLVAGKGIDKLKTAGMEVITGILEAEGLELNKRFFTFHQKKRPYIILKWAQTADGFISRDPVPANRSENRIGDDIQQLEVHRLRAETMAIMVGKNTVLADDPELTTRLVEGKNPIRIILDKNLEIPHTFKIYNSAAPTIIFNRLTDKVEENIRFVKIDFSENVLKQVCGFLHQQNIQSLLVEGGAFLLNDFIQQKLFDETRVYTNPNLKFGTGIKAPVLKGSNNND